MQITKSYTSQISNSSFLSLASALDRKTAAAEPVESPTLTAGKVEIKTCPISVKNEVKERQGQYLLFWPFCSLAPIFTLVTPLEFVASPIEGLESLQRYSKNLYR